ncbi:MAG: type II secretion system ATPase GspE [Myxococcota bacterium]
MQPQARDRYLAEVLSRRGVVPVERVESLLDAALDKGVPLTEAAVANEVATEIAVAKALADEMGLSFADAIDVGEIPMTTVERVPITYAKQHEVLVLSESERHVRCALADPFDVTCLDDIRTIFGKPADVVVAPRSVITDAINRVWEKREDTSALKGDAELDEDQLTDILDQDDDAPIIQWVNSLFAQAMRERASDIHIEPEEREVVVRYRIDGQMYVAKRASRQFMNAIVARVKIMAQLNIAEKRLPQDGRISLKIAGKSVDIRVSTIPTSRGESIVMRLLLKTAVLLGLDELGFQGREFAIMDGLIHRPDGIILVTGPTGSGKTTTLYACLNRINEPTRKILTAEDPVEYELDGIRQVGVKAQINLTFANAMRAFLRQDPDVIMVGEIRDRETAEIAIQASLTGHMVLSTIHTNDSAGAVTRLVDMGVEPFLVRSSVVGILAQRLVRKLCDDCKEPYRPTEYELIQMGLDERTMNWKRRRKVSPRYSPYGVEYKFAGQDMGPDPVFYRPVGCNSCNQHGFTGRRGIYELLVIDDKVGGLILQNADAQTVKRTAQEAGLDTLRDDGARKVLMGMTTVGEVLKAKQEDVLEDIDEPSIADPAPSAPLSTSNL